MFNSRFKSRFTPRTVGRTGQAPTLGKGGRAPAFNPAALFANGELGMRYEPYDLASLFQQNNGTVPAAAVDDPVGYLGDKSGNSYHATAATTPARPLLKLSGGLTWLLTDAFDDVLATAVDANTVFGGDYEIMIAGRFNAASADSSSPWLNDAIFCDAANYWSIYARSSGKIGIYHYDSGIKKIELNYTIGQDFVFNARHTGGNLIASVNGGAETTLAAGALSASAGLLRLFRQATYSNLRFNVAWATNRVWTVGERAGLQTLAGSTVGLTL